MEKEKVVLLCEETLLLSCLGTLFLSDQNGNCFFDGTVSF